MYIKTTQGTSKKAGGLYIQRCLTVVEMLDSPIMVTLYCKRLHTCIICTCTYTHKYGVGRIIIDLHLKSDYR